jgi:putative phosphoribosyl transferase
VCVRFGGKMMFVNRNDAGRRLAEKLAGYRNRADVVVLGVPRGGVPVALEVAKRLSAPLDIFLLRKLGVPGHEELAFGAIASGGVRLLDLEVIRALRISDEAIEHVTSAESMELKRRERAYRGERPSLNIRGKTVIVVDDGIATGSSIRAGIQALRQLQPARIVVAAPVAPIRTCNQLKSEADDVVCVLTPQSFYAIGQFYEDFSQLSDEQVLALLGQANQAAMKQAV